MRKTILNVILTGVMLVFVGCGGAMVNNIDNSGYLSGNKLSMQKVEKAIKKGAMRKGWMTKRIGSGKLESRINVRGKHLVVVDIAYNTRGYKINYKDSQNMKYDAGANTIHGNYNKWIAALEKNINYELSQIGVISDTSSRKVVQNIQPKSSSSSALNKKYAKANSSAIQGKTIYIKNIIPYANGNRIADNIKAECTINQQLAEFIKQYANEKGLKVEFKNKPKYNDLKLIVEITDAMSSGGAFRGHNKYVTISGKLVKGKKSYGSFDAARISGGGFWGAYKGSCAVLGRTVKALGQDVSSWLYSPMDGAKLGDTQLIR
ncbi:MAG: hypothetical protein C0625_11245 [Arcobacter sp.]|nr:MAG: hypothetical protein C0625_11245 [Arcobacter sp.]